MGSTESLGGTLGTPGSSGPPALPVPWCPTASPGQGLTLLGVGLPSPGESRGRRVLPPPGPTCVAFTGTAQGAHGPTFWGVPGKGPCPWHPCDIRSGVGHQDPRDQTLPGFPALQEWSCKARVCQVVLWVCKSCSGCGSHACREHALSTRMCQPCQPCQQLFPAVPAAFSSCARSVYHPPEHFAHAASVSVQALSVQWLWPAQLPVAFRRGQPMG